MFKLELDIPTYAEWKVQIEKFLKNQPEQAKKYQEQVQKFLFIILYLVIKVIF